MKIVIEIPEETYKGIMLGKWFGNSLAFYIQEGTPLSDVLKTIRGDIWLDGVNMTGEYHGVWTRFRDVEKAFDKVLKEDKE